MHQDKDRISSWLLTHYSRAILALAGYDNVRKVEPGRTQLVAPRTFPDGLYDVTLEGRSEPLPVLIEIETYAANEIGEQLRNDLMLVWLDRGRLPEAIVIVLAPKGRVTAPSQNRIVSEGGTSEISTRWRTVELWNLSAEAALNHPDVGLAPWATLMRFDDGPEELLRRVRERIDAAPDEERRVGLLEATCILAGVHFGDLDILQLLKGTDMIKERDFPAFRKLYDRIDALEKEKNDIAEQAKRDAEQAKLVAERAEAMRASLLKGIRQFLQSRFGSISPATEQVLASATADNLNDAISIALECTDESDFCTRLKSPSITN